MLDAKWISNGVIAGVVAGIVFTFLLILGNYTETLGWLIGIPNILGDLLVLFALSILAGLIFAIILGQFVRSWWSATLLGLLFGTAIWAIGPMTLYAQWSMTAIQATINQLIGLLIFGFVLGISYCFLKKGKLHKLKKPRRTINAK